jgi:hypothetical protein
MSTRWRRPRNCARRDAFGFPRRSAETALAAPRGAKLTKEGVLVIFAQTHRSREQNRREALARLLALIAAAAPKARVKTRPSLAARARRVETKFRRGETKRLRSSPVAWRRRVKASLEGCSGCGATLPKRVTTASREVPLARFARSFCLAAGASPKQADCAALFRTGKAGNVAQSDVAMMR